MIDDIQLGVIMPFPETDSSFWAAPNRGIEQAADELKNKKVKVLKFFFDKRDAQSLLSALTTAKNKNCEGLLIAPIQPAVFQRELSDYPNPIISFDSEIENDLRFSYFIGQDAYQGGRIAADIMKKMIGTRGKVLLLLPFDSNSQNESRINGFIDLIGTTSDIECEVKGYLSANKTEGAAKLFETLKDRINEYSGIFTGDESGWLIGSVIQKITDLTLENRPKIITFDLTLDNRYAIAHGLIDFIIGQKPDLQGYLGILDLYEAVMEDPNNRHLYVLPTRKIMPLDIFGAENLPDLDD